MLKLLDRHPVPKTQQKPKRLVKDVRPPAEFGVLPPSYGQPPAAADGTEPGELLVVQVRLIDPSPFQPRTEFDATELAELAASIQAHGLAQPPLVRPKEGRWELVAGERRLRASKIAGLKQIPVMVRELTDQQAAELCLVENLQRTNLNPIEKAQGYQRYMQEMNCTQEQLAERLQLTQGGISNLVRLLELPKAIQRLIISGVISASLSRVLVPYAICPPVLEDLAVLIAKEKEPLNEDDLRDRLDDVLRKFPKPKHEEWIGNYNRRVEMRKLTAEEHAACQPIKVPDAMLYRKGKPIEIYANRPAWKKLWNAHLATIKKEKPAARNPGAKPAKGGKPKKLTPAQERAAAQKAAEELTAAIGEWKADWLRRLCATAVATNESAQARLLLLAVEEGSMMFIEDVVRRHVKQPVKQGKRRIAILATVCQANEKAMCHIMRDLAVGMLWDAKRGPQMAVSEDEIGPLAEFLKIDLAVEWGRLDTKQRESFLSLHDFPQLKELADEWGLPTLGSRSKADVLKVIRAPGKTLPIPKALLKAKCV